MKSVSPHRDNSLPLCREAERRQNVSRPKLSCDVKRELLRDYIAALERVQVAEREHTAMLLTAGTSDGMALRSSQRLKQSKNCVMQHGSDIQTTATCTTARSLARNAPAPLAMLASLALPALTARDSTRPNQPSAILHRKIKGVVLEYCCR
jgi:hypothetical protein